MITNGNRIIAKSSSNKHTFQASSPPTLSVADEALGMGFLDLIILGWIVMARDRDRSNKALKVTTKLVNLSGS
ncbi:hypothetical protein DL93DRAFT_2078928 [Clavulina sp. PMI_390]|nr:hypothetical protein DL93DRAFT_2078928 [Clavulina sp. PMI_390]